MFLYLLSYLTHTKICYKCLGSCLLWVMSTEISVDIAVDIAVDTRSIVGRHSVDTRSTLSRQSVDIAVDSRSILGRDRVDSRSRCVSADIAYPQ